MLVVSVLVPFLSFRKINIGATCFCGHHDHSCCMRYSGFPDFQCYAADMILFSKVYANMFLMVQRAMTVLIIVVIADARVIGIVILAIAMAAMAGAEAYEHSLWHIKPQLVVDNFEKSTNPHGGLSTWSSDLGCSAPGKKNVKDTTTCLHEKCPSIGACALRAKTHRPT